MVFLIAFNAGLHIYLAVTGNVHPLSENVSPVTRLVISGIFTAVLLLCLFRLYQGSPAVRQLFGWCSALVALSISVTLAWGVLVGAFPVLWICLDAVALVLAAFAAWVCFFSSSANRFFSHQNHKS